MNKPLLAGLGALSAVALTLAPLSAADALGGADRAAVKTNVKLNPNFTTPGSSVVFKGKVDSRSAKCVGGRKVVLTSKADGTKYGTDTTNGQGAFVIKFSQQKPAPSDGMITATAAKTRVGGVTCAAGSDTVTLG